MSEERQWTMVQLCHSEYCLLQLSKDQRSASHTPASHRSASAHPGERGKQWRYSEGSDHETRKEPLLKMLCKYYNLVWRPLLSTTSHYHHYTCLNSFTTKLSKTIFISWVMCCGYTRRIQIVPEVEVLILHICISFLHKQFFFVNKKWTDKYKSLKTSLGFLVNGRRGNWSKPVKCWSSMVWLCLGPPWSAILLIWRLVYIIPYLSESISGSKYRQVYIMKR